MAKLSETVKKAISKQDVFTVATSNQKGVPNVAYVKYLKIFDDQTILIADNYFSKTKDNIMNNNKIDFVVLDDEKGSYQVKGKAERFEKGSMFDEVQNWVPERLPRVAAVVMTVEEIYNGAERIS